MQVSSFNWALINTTPDCDWPASMAPGRMVRYLGSIPRPFGFDDCCAGSYIELACRDGQANELLIDLRWPVTDQYVLLLRELRCNCIDPVKTCSCYKEEEVAMSG